MLYRGDCTSAQGQPRLTNDIDLTILTGFGQEARYIDELLKICNGRIPDAREFALTNRILKGVFDNKTKRINIEIDKAVLAFHIFNSGSASADYVTRSTEDERMSDR